MKKFMVIDKVLELARDYKDIVICIDSREGWYEDNIIEVKLIGYSDYGSEVEDEIYVPITCTNEDYDITIEVVRYMVSDLVKTLEEYEDPLFLEVIER